MAKLNSWNHPAPHGSRFLAQFIDIVIVRNFFFRPLLHNELGKGLVGAVFGLTYIGYFVFFQSLYR